jgi:hypothetical protein
MLVQCWQAPSSSNCALIHGFDAFCFFFAARLAGPLPLCFSLSGFRLRAARIPDRLGAALPDEGPPAS